jgi:PAS domain S-box-containing protein
MTDNGSSIGVSADDAVVELRQLAGPVFAALERSGMAIAVTDPRRDDNPIVFLNAAFTRLTGYGADAIGRNCRFLQSSETDEQAIAEISTALANGEPVDVEILNFRKDESRFWNRLSIVPVLNQTGQPAFFLSTQVDVTAAHDAAFVAAALEHSKRDLHEVNERMRTTLALAGVAGAWEWDIAEGRIVGDPRFATLYGLTPDEAAKGFPASVFFSIIHPLDQTRIRLAVGGMLRGAEVFSKEYRLVLADGSIRWVQARGRSYLDGERHPVRFSGALVDITDQKRVEEQLRIAQTAGGVGTFEYVDGYGTASVSEQFCALLGLHAARDLPVRTINNLVQHGDPPIIESSAPTGAGATSQVEFRIVRPDNGQLRWLTRRGEYLREAETSGLRFSGVIYDVTEAKHIEEELRTLNETLELRVEERTQERDRVWQVSRDILGVADRDGVWLSVNPAWMRILGWSAKTLVGRNSAWLEHPENSKIQTAFARAAKGETLVFENDFRTREGDYRGLSWTIVPFEGLFYCVARDVTDQKRQAEALARAEDQLRQSQKMEAVGQLTGGIAHDFNNLLTGITGSLDIIRRRVAAGKTQDIMRFMDAASSSAHRAAALTHRLLAFARRQSLDTKSSNINGLVSGLDDMLQRTLMENITFETILPPDLWPAMTDANQLENALLNVSINARDAMPNGGRLTIETSNVTLDAAYAAANEGVVPGDYVLLCITDTGTGMTPEVLAKAFDPFFTTKPIGQGTGLGLSMIYGFVKQSGGHVHIDSTLGQGTAIKLYLRRALSEQETQNVTSQAGFEPGQGETILVVEDDETVRMLITEVLSTLGYRYLEAADAQAAIPFLQSASPIDLLITDVGLPNMNGRQLAEIAREHRPSLKVLFVTGYAQNATVRGGFLAPGMEMITKPFALDVLSTKVSEMIGR